MTAGIPTPSGGRLLALGAVVAAVAIQLPIFDRWFGLLDEGYMVSLAADIRRGQMLYRDVYVDAPFPAAFYLLAGWFGIFGTSVWAERVLAVGVFAVFVGASVRLATLVLPRLGAVVFAILLLCYRIWAFPHWHVFSYSSLAVTLLTLAALMVAAAGARPRAGALLVAGLLAGAAVLSKQDYGVAVTGALGLYLLLRWVLFPGEPDRVRRSVRDAAWLGAGAALAVAPVLGVIAAAGAWKAFAYQTVVLPLAGASSGAYVPMPPILPLLHQDPLVRSGLGSYLPAILQTLRWEAIAAGWAYRESALWDVALKACFYAPFMVWWTAALWWGVRTLGRRPPDHSRLLVLAYAGGFLLAFSPPRDWVHLMMIYPPAVLLACVLASNLLARLPRAGQLAVGLPAALAVLLLVVDSARLGRELRAAFQWPITMPRGGFYTDGTHGPILQDVQRVLDAVPPGTPVPVYPMNPMLGFLADRATVAGYHVIWPFQAPERDAQIIGELERVRPPTVLYSLSQYAHLGSFRQNAPRLFHHLVDRYELTTTFSRRRFGPLYVGLSRDDGPPDTVLPELLAHLPAAAPAAAAVWPFTAALATRVGTAAAPERVGIPLALPPGAARLEFVYGINPERWLTLGDGPFVFRMDVDGTRLFEATLDPAGALGDRRWAEGAIDLVPYAGRTVQLTLSVEGPRSLAGDPDLTGWARFRLDTMGPGRPVAGVS